MALRVGLVGAGGIARQHARACGEVAAVDLVAITDVQAEAAHRLADRHGVPGRYTDLATMLAHEALDIAIVATWGDSHAAVTETLAGSGRVRAILCEKPFSRTAAEAERMAQSAAAHGVLLAEAFKFRHHPLHLRAHELIAAGHIGHLNHVRATFATSMPPAMRHPDANWRYSAQRGGGAIFDLACYCVHHARWLMNAEPELVYASGRWDEAAGIDETVTALMRFPGGRTATWWVSFVDHPSQTVEIYGTEGLLRHDLAWNNEDQPTTLELIGAAGRRHQEAWPPTFQFARQLEHLAGCLNEGHPHRIPTSHSVAQMRVLDALHASLRSGRAERP